MRILSLQLKKLAAVFEKANTAPQGKENLHRDSDEARIVLGDRVAQSKDLIGDFKKTLDDCEKLLVENAKYGKHGNSVYMTAKWHSTGLEADSVLLRQRIQFHCTKTTFVLEPLKIELLQTINENVEIVKRQGRKILKVVTGLGIESLGPPAVSAELARRYETQAQSERPFDSAEPYPLKQCINALLFHFSQSTVNVSNYQTPSSEQFHALFKTRWLLDKIHQKSIYRRMGASLTRSVVARVEDELEAQYERFDELELEVQIESIVTLDNDQFRIWVIESPKSLPRSATEESAGEEKILEIPLSEEEGETKQGLMVFRHSNTEFRLLRTSISQSGVEQVINTHHFRCVPWYAMPNKPATKNTLQICHNHVHTGNFFDACTREDVFALQRAFTNYRVLFNNSQLRWELQRDRLYHKSLKGPKDEWSGIQIWQWDPLQRWIAQSPEAGPSESALTETSSDRRGSTLAGDYVSAFPSKAASIVPQGPNGDDIVATMRPKVPAIIIFTKRDDKLSFLYLPLEAGIGVNLKRCTCHKADSNCRFVILEKNPGSRLKFETKIHTAASIQDWNLFLFAQPKPPEYKSMETLNDVVEYTLEFATVTARKEFQIWFFRAIKQRQVDLKDFNGVARGMRHHENRPNKRVNDPTLLSPGATSRQSSVTLSPNLGTRSGRTSSSSTSSPLRHPATASSSQRTSTSSHTSIPVSTDGDASAETWASRVPKPQTRQPSSNIDPSSPPPPPYDENATYEHLLPERMPSTTFVASPTDYTENTFHYPDSNYRFPMRKSVPLHEDGSQFGPATGLKGKGKAKPTPPYSSSASSSKSHKKVDSGVAISPSTKTPSVRPRSPSRVEEWTRLGEPSFQMSLN